MPSLLDPPIPPNLIREIARGNCVAFVGAGFSAAAKVPSWANLLQRMASDGRDASVKRHVLGLLRKGSSHALDEAAQTLEDALGRGRFLKSLASTLGSPQPTAAMERRLRWLSGIPFRLILTTNFDGLLHGPVAGRDTYRDALRVPPERWWDARHTVTGEGALVIKLHGDLLHPTHGTPGVVITRRDYRRRLYEDAAYVGFLRAIMATTTVLFLGFSFTDAYLNELRSEVLALLAQGCDSAPVAYALVNDAPSKTRTHYRRHEGIELLSYDSHDGTDFSGFDEWLEALYGRTNSLLRFGRHLENRRLLWVDPNPENNQAAFSFLNAAARAARRSHALTRVATAEEGLAALRQAQSSAPFDLVLTHWGDGAARNASGKAEPAAVRLLEGRCSENLRVPVLVFAGERGAEERRRLALQLGALGYCYRFETLFRTIDATFSPVGDVG